MIAEGATNVRYLDTPIDEAGQASHNLKVARRLAEAEIPVIPLRRDEETLKSGEVRGKHTPHITGWQKKATINRKIIRRWSHEFPGFVPGIITGRASRIAVLDLDRKNGKDGFAELHRMGLDPDNMSAWQVRTTTGGGHRYFAWALPWIEEKQRSRA